MGYICTTKFWMSSTSSTQNSLLLCQLHKNHMCMCHWKSKLLKEAHDWPCYDLHIPIFFLSTILAFAAAFFSFLGSIFNAVLLASLLLARNERARVIFHLINVNYFLFSQVTTPFILSVCLADFLFAIVVLPTQATRWQVSTAPHNPHISFSRFMSRDWEVGVGPEDGMTCQVYPIILFTVQVLISHVFWS